MARGRAAGLFGPANGASGDGTGISHKPGRGSGIYGENSASELYGEVQSALRRSKDLLDFKNVDGEMAIALGPSRTHTMIENERFHNAEHDNHPSQDASDGDGSVSQAGGRTVQIPTSQISINDLKRGN